MASPVNALSSLINSGTTSQTTGTAAPAPTEQMFLQLLVAQMKNQDPTNPSDPTQFVTQLAQFSQLEQVIGIRSDIESAQATSKAAGQAANQSTSQTANQNTGQKTTTTKN